MCTFILWFCDSNWCLICSQVFSWLFYWSFFFWLSWSCVKEFKLPYKWSRKPASMYKHSHATSYIICSCTNDGFDIGTGAFSGDEKKKNSNFQLKLLMVCFCLFEGPLLQSRHLCFSQSFPGFCSLLCSPGLLELRCIL